MLHWILLFPFLAFGYSVSDLQNNDPAIRLATIRELRAKPDPAQMGAIIAAMEKEADYPRDYLQNLKRPEGPICGNDIYFMMQKRKKDEVQRFEKAAVEALLAIGEPAKENLLKGLHSPNVDLQRTYVRAQIEAKDPAALPILLKLARQHSPIQREAYQAVAHYRDPSAMALHLETLKAFLSASHVLEFALPVIVREKPPEAIPILLGHLQNNRRNVQQRAISALGQFGGPEATKAVLGRLKSSDKQIQLSALAAIQKIGTNENIVDLQPLLHQPEPIRTTAARAIQALSRK